jgi:hypothetical protein
MAYEQYSNNAATTLNGDINDAVTSLVVASAASFPASANYRIIIGSEIMLVTAGAGTTTWTVTRGAESTTPTAHSSGAAVTHVLTAASLLALPPRFSVTDTVASKPSAADSGRLFLPSDGFYVERDTGAAWAPWGPLFPMTPPVSGDFAWVNQGGASIDTTYGGVHLYAPQSAGDNVRICKKAAPATPYTITACLIPFIPGYDQNHCGIGFRQSSDGKLHVLTFFYGGSGFSVSSLKYTNPTTYTAGYGDWLLKSSFNCIWFQISDDGVNRICRFSLDGQHFYQTTTIGRTDFLTADEVLFFCNSKNATSFAAMTLLSWKET